MATKSKNFLDEAEDLGPAEQVQQPKAKKKSTNFLEDAPDLGEGSESETIDIEPSLLEKVINVIDIPGSVVRTGVEAAISPEREVIPAVSEQLQRTMQSPTMAASTAPTGRNIIDVGLEQMGYEGRSPEETEQLKKEYPKAFPIMKGIADVTSELAVETLTSPLSGAAYLGRKLIRKPLVSASEKQAAKAVAKYVNKPMVGKEGVDPFEIGARLVAEDLQGQLRNAPRFYEKIAGKRHIQKIRPDSLDTLVIKRGKKEGGLISKTSEDINSMLKSVEKQAPESAVVPADVGLRVIFENIRKKLSATSGETPNLDQIQGYVENALKPFDVKTEVFPGEKVLQKMPGSLELSEQLKTIEKKVPVARKITITQVQELRKNIGKLLSDRDFYATPDKSMAAETEVLRDLYRELGNEIKTKLANVDVLINGKSVNAAEFYEAQNNKLKHFYDLESMLEFTPLKELQDNDLNQMVFGALTKGSLVAGATGASMLFGLPQYATTGGIIAGGVGAGMSAAKTAEKALPEYLTSIFKQAANVAPAATAAGTQGAIMYARNGQFVPSLQEPTPEDILKFKLPTTTQGFIQNKKTVLAKLAQEGFAGEQIDAIAQALNGDEVDLSDSVRVLYSQFPGVFDRYTSKNGKRFAIFDGEFIDPEQKAQAADQVSKRKDLNSIQKAKMISTINSGELPEGL